MDAGAEQVVFLGAGYDTRACRFAGELANTPIFEVDLRATQERKRARLDGTPMPENVAFVDISEVEAVAIGIGDEPRQSRSIAEIPSARGAQSRIRQCDREGPGAAAR